MVDRTAKLEIAVDDCDKWRDLIEAAKDPNGP